MTDEDTTTQRSEPRSGGSAISVIRAELTVMSPEFQTALPSHIPVERFARVALTAIQGNPELLEVDRRSLWKSCMQAAQDGLLPDGKEGAIVVRWNNKARRKEAAWQPMIYGIRKKAQNAGLISTWEVHTVHANDAFEYELGDDPFIRHKPALTNRGDLIGAYSIATLKDGSKSREVMGIDEINATRDEFSTAWQAFKADKIKSTPWASAPGEMAKKTVAHRHGKILPLSTDIRDLLLKGDELRTEETLMLSPPEKQEKPKQTIADKFAILAGTSTQTPETAITIDQVAGPSYDNDDTGSMVALMDPLIPTNMVVEPVQSPAPASESAAPTPTDEERRAAAEAIIQRVGGMHAKDGGMPAVKNWIEELDADARALITPLHHNTWRALAKKYKQPTFDRD